MTSLSNASVRRPAVAGLFYPGDRADLSRTVSEMLAQAPRRAGQPPKALIAPHAGYVYSGPIAASAYALLEPLRDVVKRVVLLGPTHRVAVRGLALPASRQFATPLGTVEIDADAIEQLRGIAHVGVSEEAHA